MSVTSPDDPRPAVGPIPFEDFRAELLALYAEPMRARSTRAKMRQALDIVGGLIGAGTTAELTVPFVARFVASRPPGESPYTTFSLLANLRSACLYAVQAGYLRANPFDFRGVGDWVRRGEPTRERLHHSRQEIARVLALMARDAGRKDGWARWRARRLLALASTVAYTGMRKNEAIFLKVEDVRLEDRLILIVARHRLKTARSAQPVPIPEALAPVLADWIPWAQSPGGWLFPNADRSGAWMGGSPGYRPIDRMKRLGERAGVEGFTFQSLRHSWATHAEYWGLSELMVQRILRHTSVRTQATYRHPDPMNMRADAGGIGFGAPGRGVEGE